MKIRAIFLLLSFFFVLVLIGCSALSGQVGSFKDFFNTERKGIQDVCAPNQIEYDLIPVGVSDCSLDGAIRGGMGALGLFSLKIDINEMRADLTSLRKSALTDVLETVDITNFLQLAPCTNCVKIKSVALDENSKVVLSIGIKHPFPVGDPLKPISGKNRADLHVFNIEGIIVSDQSDVTALGKKFSTILSNPDGYTGYLDSSLDEIFPTAANIHPYIMHFDDYSAGNFNPLNPMGFASVTTPPPSGNLVMAMGCDYDYKDYVFNLHEHEVHNFLFVVGCTYAVSSASKSQRFNPEYRIPQHNKKAASEVSVEIVSNSLAENDTSSSAIIRVNVVDINHGVPVGDALNQMLADSSVSQILVDIPNVTNGYVSFSTTPLSGSGHSPSDPLVFEGTITNALNASKGNYIGLVKVLDNYPSGLNTNMLLNGKDGIKRVDPFSNPLTGLFAINEFATYQSFSIDVGGQVSITVLIPNGGEDWPVWSSQEIRWDSKGVTGTVFIEYSKDNFASDVHTIATDEPNDGSFIWNSVANDPSSTVRVRISSTANPSINDVSDNNFKISIPMFDNGWARTWGGYGFDWIHGVAEDSSRNVYSTGYFEGTVNFNPDTSGPPWYLTSSGMQDVVLSKLNIDGELIWAKKWGGIQQDIGRAMVLDSAGNVYVAGYFQGSANFNPNPGTPVNLTSKGGQDVFISKLTQSGDLVWAKSWGGTSDDYGRGVGVDAAGNVYVGGYFRGTVNFNPNPGTPVNRTSNGSDDAFLVKLDADGNLVWVKSWGSTSEDYGIYVACDPAGNACITGHFSGTVNFNPNPGTPVNYTSVGYYDFYVSKFNTAGELQWARTWGSETYDYAAGVSIDPNGNVFVCGDFQWTCNFNPWGTPWYLTASIMDPCISKFDANGNFQWAKSWGGSGHDRSYACAAGPDGSVSISGHFNGTVNFNPNPGTPVEFTSNGMTDAYIIKLNSIGELIWARAFGGDLNDFGYATHIANTGNVYVAGDYQNTVNFSPYPGQPDWHTAVGSYDHYVVKYLPNGYW